MPQSIAEASRFVIGSLSIRAAALQGTSNTEARALSIENVAIAARQKTETGLQIMESIQKIAAAEAPFFRKSPLYVSSSEATLASRQNETLTFKKTNVAFNAIIELDGQLGSVDHRKTLKARFVEAFTQIDNFPNKTDVRRSLIENFYDSCTRLSSKPEVMIELLDESQREYMHQLFVQETQLDIDILPGADSEPSPG